jgi:hypothetical protein
MDVGLAVLFASHAFFILGCVLTVWLFCRASVWSCPMASFLLVPRCVCASTSITKSLREQSTTDVLTFGTYKCSYLPGTPQLGNRASSLHGHVATQADHNQNPTTQQAVYSSSLPTSAEGRCKPHIRHVPAAREKPTSTSYVESSFSSSL